MTFGAHELTVSYGTRPVVDGVSLDVAPGEWIAVIGPNGAGKSTLLSTMLGLLPADSGHAELDGTAVPELSRREVLCFAQSGLLLWLCHSDPFATLRLDPLILRVSPFPWQDPANSYL